jgi:hypothetical protein
VSLTQPPAAVQGYGLGVFAPGIQGGDYKAYKYAQLPGRQACLPARLPARPPTLLPAPVPACPPACLPLLT